MVVPGSWRRRRESNPDACTGLCRPLPKSHSAIACERACRKGIRSPRRADDGIRTRDPPPWQGDALPTEPRPHRTWVRWNCSRSCRSRRLGPAKASLILRRASKDRWIRSVWAAARVPTTQTSRPCRADPRDPTRAAILQALLPDRPLAAGELAPAGQGQRTATAGFHLAKLLDGGMIAVARRSRHRYYRLVGHEVAAAPRALGLISPTLVRTLRRSAGGRAGRGPDLLRPPGGPGRGGAARRHAPSRPAPGTIIRPNGP